MNSQRDDGLRAAVAHFQAGRRAEAESLCAEILSAEAQNVTALHLLGILHCQQGEVGKGAVRLGELSQGPRHRARLRGSAAQVRQPIYKDSVQSWKRFDHQLAPVLEIL